MYESLSQGAAILFTYNGMFYLLAGTLCGIIFGALPGFNTSTTLVILLPFTYGLDAGTSLIFLAGVAGAGIYGGSITAILFRTPGTIGSAITAIDGYEMTKRGRGVEALGISTTASSIGGLFGGLCLFLFAPPLALFATKFSFPEMFVLIIWAFTIIGLASGSVLKGLGAGLAGMLLASIGADPMFAFPRMTMGIPNLFEGINLLTAIMGFFCFAEMMRISRKEFIVENVSSVKGTYVEALRGVVLTLRRPWVLLRGSVIGVVVGALPAAGTAVANALSYTIQKRLAKDPWEYGKGKPEGVLAAESANNATEGATLIPTVTLGIPGSNIGAILLVAMTLQGVVVGPRVFIESGHILYALMLAILVAQPMMFCIGFLISKYMARVSMFPVDKLIPYILVCIAIGTYAFRGSSFDFYLMALCGVIGYFMYKNGYSVIAIVLPFVLGPDLERSFLISMRYSKNDPLIFFNSTICLVLWGLIIVTLFGVPIWQKVLLPLFQVMMRSVVRSKAG